MFKVRTFTCNYCGAEIKIPTAKVIYVVCPYCGSVFRAIDLRSVTEVYTYRVNIDHVTAFNNVKARIAGIEAVPKDITRKANLKSIKLFHVPYYIIEIERLGEKVDYSILAIKELHGVKIPGDYDTLPLGTRDVFRPRRLEYEGYIQPLREIEKPKALLYYPFYMLEYTYKGRKFKACVDAVTGNVVYAEYPIRYPLRIAIGYGFLFIILMFLVSLIMYKILLGLASFSPTSQNIIPYIKSWYFISVGVLAIVGLIAMIIGSLRTRGRGVFTYSEMRL